jgi:hypothetical protein
MWFAEHTLETTAQPDEVWEQLQRVERWPLWDPGLDSAELSGGFRDGAQGTVRFQGEPARPFLLAAVQAEHGFTALSRLPLAELRHIHRQEHSAMGTRMTHRIEISGPLSWFYGWRLGRKLKDGLAPGLRALARLAS